MNVELHLVGQSPMSFLEHRESIFSVQQMTCLLCSPVHVRLQNS